MHNLYEQKGLIITELEALQEQLRLVNQALAIERQKQQWERLAEQQAIKKEETE